MTRAVPVPCTGCGAPLPPSDAPGHRYVNASPACWERYGLVPAAEYSDPVLFGTCHELSVDAYIAQHPGGAHPTRSVVVHLAGLHLALDREVTPARIPTARARLTQRVWEGPDPDPPAAWGPLTVLDLAAAAGTSHHAEVVRAYATEVWHAWAHEHARVAAFVGGV